jgi:hypothetical protein
MPATTPLGSIGSVVPWLMVNHTQLCARAPTIFIPQLVELMRAFYAESDYPLETTLATDCFSALLGNESYGADWLLCHEGDVAGSVVLTVQFSMGFGGLSALIDDLLFPVVAPWRDLPSEFGPWKTVFNRFDRWSSRASGSGC